jgi:hypothetical protein
MKFAVVADDFVLCRGGEEVVVAFTDTFPATRIAFPFVAPSTFTAETASWISRT